MPTVAAFLDGLRAEFGTATIDAAIRAGLRPDANFRFFAQEGGHSLGTPNDWGHCVPVFVPPEPKAAA